MGKQALHSEAAPRAIGPYSQAVRAGGLVFVSGQIGIDPRTGRLVEGGTETETRQVLANLGSILAAAGLGFEHVVRTTIYLVDLADFPAVNDIYGRSLPAPHPARATVGVAALPLGARVEIDAVAQVNESSA